MIKLSIEIARHAERVRRYEVKLNIRARKRDGLKQEHDLMAAQVRAMQNVGSCGGLGFSGAANVSPVDHTYYGRGMDAREIHFWRQFGL